MAKMSTAEFLIKARRVWNDRYDLGKVVYTGAHVKITVTCPKHGDWQTDPYNFLGGHGCMKCSYDGGGRRKEQRSTTVEFITKARKVHGYKYDYSLTVYTMANQKVTIICPTHGPFEVRAGSHIYKNRQGCPKCTKVGRPLKMEIYAAPEEFVPNQIPKGLVSNVTIEILESLAYYHEKLVYIDKTGLAIEVWYKDNRIWRISDGGREVNTSIRAIGHLRYSTKRHAWVIHWKDSISY